MVVQPLYIYRKSGGDWLSPPPLKYASKGKMHHAMHVMQVTRPQEQALCRPNDGGE